MKLISGVGASLFSSDEVAEEDIERLKEGDMLESSFGEFAKQTPTLFATLIDERDQYMAARLRERSDGAKRVLAVVGAGHLKGMAGYLETGTEAPAAAAERLCEIRKQRRIPWFTIVLLALIFGGIAWGYHRGGASLGRDLLLQWVAWTCGLTALGALLAGARPLAILVATLVAPFKPFRPTFPSGMFSALIDLRSRKPAYPDFLALRDDAQTLRGWYRNRVTRVLLVFLLTNLGTVAGEYVAGVSIFGKLVGG